MNRLVAITLVCLAVLSSPLLAQAAAPTKDQAAVVRCYPPLAMAFNFSRCLGRTAIEYAASLSIEVIRTSPTTARKNDLTPVD